MNHQLLFEQMTFEDKLSLMEELWDHLCHLPESMPSPDWHEDCLTDRAQRVERGESVFTAWEEAKHRLRSLIP